MVKKFVFAVTPNMVTYLPNGVRSVPYQDTAEDTVIYRVMLTKAQYNKMFMHSENIGGWIVRFEPKLSKKIKTKKEWMALMRKTPYGM